MLYVIIIIIKIRLIIFWANRIKENNKHNKILNLNTEIHLLFTYNYTDINKNNNNAFFRV